ncbi:Ig-like domain-containing protein [Vibrio aestuarianus]|uniref:Ig-like domain-containing protein n=4 Tax=Vibrio TaxID=662 RepID=A0AAX3U601_9VIBR|nr:Ig-like domain-containing protein [Vibrio aestuarianus]WGK82636.1 Ig-like domain-containing protein [Vibrio aestuarianus]
MGRSTFLLGSNLAVGQRIAVDVNGNVRILNPGEKALPGEIIMNPNSLGENDGALNPNVQISQIAPDGSGTDITDDVNAILAALEQGIDPTQLGEEFATAAGESNGSSPTDSVSIARDAAEIIAVTNFDTSALTSLGLSETQSLGLLEQYFLNQQNIETTPFDSTPINVNIDIDPITSDSIVTAQDVNSTVIVTGSVSGESFSSGTVTLIINGVEYSGGVVDGRYSIEVNGRDLQADSDNVVDARVEVANQAGNTGSATSTEFYLVDTFSRGTITINSVTEDNLINKNESENTVSVSGSVGGDAEPGDQVTVVINGTSYQTSVLSDKTWEVEVQGSELIQDTQITATVTGSDRVGNEFIGSTSRDYLVDMFADAGAPSVTIVDDNNPDDGVINKDELGNDNVQVSVSVNGAELAEGGSVNLTISNGGVESTVTLSLNDEGKLVDAAGTEYTYANGTITWTETVAEGASIKVDATQTDRDGNVSKEGSDNATVDTVFINDGDYAPSVSIVDDNNPDDGVINKDELGNDNVQVSVSVNGAELAEGGSVNLAISNGGVESTVTLSLNDEGKLVDAAGTEYTYANGTITWTETVAEGASIKVDATQTDRDGNVSKEGSDNATVDTVFINDGDYAPLVTIVDDNNPDDGVINKDELGNDQVQVKVDVNHAELVEGGEVTLTISNGGSVSTVTLSLNEDGEISDSNYSYNNGTITWTETVAEGASIKVDATQTDRDGNVSLPGSDEAKVDTTADAGAPSVSIVDDNNPDDGVINKDELGNDQVQVKVDVNHAELVEGGDVTLTINGSAVSLKLDGDALVNLDGSTQNTYQYNNGTITWTETVAEGASIKVDATQTDRDGNVSKEGSDNATVDTVFINDGDYAPSVSIVDDNNPDDGVINKDELGNDNVQVSVSVNGAELAEGGSVNLAISNGGVESTVTLSLNDEGKLVDAAGTEYTYANGTITWTETVAEGASIKVDATQTDRDGNVSKEGSDNATVDTVFINDGDYAPLVTIVDDNNPDDGVINKDELGNDQVQVKVDVNHAELVEGGEVTLTISNGGSVSTVTLSLNEDGEISDSNYSYNNGTITWTETVAEGASIKVDATQTDRDGNVSLPGSDEAKVDTTADAGAPSVSIVDDNNPDDGVINKDELGNDQVQVKVDVNHAELVEGGDVTLTINGSAVSLKLDGDALVNLDGSTQNTYQYNNGTITWTETVAEGARIKVDATQTDRDGNVSKEGSDNATVDTVFINDGEYAPSVSIVDDANDDGVINKDELGNDNVQVKVEVNHAELVEGGDVTLTINGSAVFLKLDGDALVNLDGSAQNTYQYNNGTITWTETVAEGASIKVDATQTDRDGNVSKEGSDNATVDTVFINDGEYAPSVTIVDDNNPDDGVINKAELGNDNVQVSVSVNGAELAEGGSVNLTISNGGVESTVTLSLNDEGKLVDAAGTEYTYANGTITWTETVAEGASIKVDATQTDRDGNVSKEGSDNATVDTVFINDGDYAPSVSIVDDANDDGVINKAELGNDNVQVSVSVNGAELAEGGSVNLTISNGGVESTVTLSLNDEGKLVDAAGTEYTYANGTITWTETVAEGASIKVDATQTDRDGNVSKEGSDNATVDTVFINDGDYAPLVSIVDDANDDGVINKDELGNDQVQVKVDVNHAELVEGGEVTLTISNGGSASTVTLSLNEDGEISDSNYSYNNGTITWTETVAEGASIKVDATQTDSDGNVSLPGSDEAKVDTTADAGAPSVSIVDDNNPDDGVINKDELGNDQVQVKVDVNHAELVEGGEVTLTISNGGSASTVTLSLNEDGEISDSNYNYNNGTITWTETVAEGTSIKVDATQTDSDGNVSLPGSDEAKVDTTADAGAPSVSIVDDNNPDDGVINKDELGNDQVQVKVDVNHAELVEGGEVTLTISNGGSASTVTLSLNEDGEISDSNYSYNNGTITWTETVAEGASIKVDATQTDSDGNVSLPGSDEAKVDTTADAGAPSVSIVDDNNPDDGVINKDELGNDQVQVKVDVNHAELVEGGEVTLTISNGGSASTVTLSLNEDGEISDSNYNYNNGTITWTETVAEGTSIKVDATQTDSDGNVSLPGSDEAKVDTTADAGAPSVSIVDDNNPDDGVINKDELGNDQVQVKVDVNHAELVEGGEVTLTISNGGSASTVTLSLNEDGEISDSNYSYNNGTITWTETVAEGASIKVDATQTDSDGNVSLPGSDEAKVDTTADAGAPSVSIVDDNNPDDGVINKDELGNDQVQVKVDVNHAELVEGGEVTLTISNGGSASTVTLSLNEDGEISDSNYNYNNGTITWTETVAEGTSIKVDATQTDSDGNVSLPGSDEAKVDTTADAGAPSVSIVDDNNPDDGVINKDELGNDQVQVKVDVNHAELVEGGEVTLTISNGGSASTVTLSLNEDGEISDSNYSYNNGTITWTETVAEGASIKVDATQTDRDGNVSLPGSDNAKVDTIVLAEIDILNIAEDHRISASEANGDVLVVGFANKDAQPGDKIDFYIGNKLIGSGVVSNVPHLDSSNNQIGYKFESIVKGSDLIPENITEGSAILTAKLTVTDTAGNTTVATTTEPYFFDVIAPDSPTITKVTDDSVASDYSTVTLHGTGSEPGNTIEVFAKDANGNYVSIGTAQVVDGNPEPTWTLDISNEAAIPLNDNEFLYAKETDTFGNTSEASKIVHYYHGTYDPALSEVTDDFVLLGKGDDLLKVDQDDANDMLVADGGAGTDTAQFNFASDAATFMLNSDGSVTITENNGDVNTFIEFEQFKFTDGTKSFSELFAPIVTLERDNDEIIDSNRDSVGFTVKLPIGAIVGATLLLVIEGNQTSIELNASHIAAGVITQSILTSDIEGDELTISAELQYPGQDSGIEFKDSDALGVNTLPVAKNDDVATDEDKTITINVLGNDSDADNDALTVTAIVPAEQGSVSIVNNQVVFTPAENFTGKATISYTITDSQKGSSAAVVEVAVNSINDAPELTGDLSASMDEAGTYTLTAADLGFKDVDDNADGVVFTISNLSSGLVYVDGVEATIFTGTQLQAGLVTFVHDGSETLTASFSVNVEDGNEDNSEPVNSTFEFTVNPVNDAPTAAGGNVDALEDSVTNIQWASLGVSDVDSAEAALGVIITSLPINGILEYKDGDNGWKPVQEEQTLDKATFDSNQVRFIPAANESGSDVYNESGIGDQNNDYVHIGFKATDGQINSITESTLIIDIKPVADAPNLDIVEPDLVLPQQVFNVSTWDNVVIAAKYGLGNGVSGAELIAHLSALDASVASQSTTANAEDSASNATSPNQAVLLTGLVYLEAGTSYDFVGRGDDSLAITIGGQLVDQARWGVSSGQIIGSEFTPQISGYYPISIYHHNQNGQGNFDVNVSIDNQSAVNLSNSNLSIVTNVDALEASELRISGLQVDENGVEYYDVYQVNEGRQDSAIPLSEIDASLSDIDGSESLAILLSGLPQGAIISDGTHSVTISTQGNVDVSNWSLDSLVVTPPLGSHDDFTITVTATSTEKANGDKAQSTQDIHVVVHEQSPTVTQSDHYSGNEDQVITGNVLLNDSDEDDALSITKISVEGQEHQAGQFIEIDEGILVVSANGNFSFEPTQNWSGTVPTIVYTTNTGKTDTLTIEVKPVADAPNVTAVFGDTINNNVSLSSELHLKLVNADSSTTFTAEELNELGQSLNGSFMGANIVGSGLNDIIIGTNDGDSLSGEQAYWNGKDWVTTGNDIFIGGAGNDAIFGGNGSATDLGLDTVVYSGNLADYTLDFYNNHGNSSKPYWHVSDSNEHDTQNTNNPYSEGEHLYEIERLIFADAIVELNQDGTYTVVQEAETEFNLAASLADRDSSEFLDEIQINGLPDDAKIINKDTGEVLGRFQEVDGEHIWIIDVQGIATQHINYDNLVVRYSSADPLDVDVTVVAKETALADSDLGASTTVNVASSSDVNADQGGAVPTTLITLALDSSGSMNTKPLVSDLDQDDPDRHKTRMELVLEASISLLENVQSQQGSDKALVQLVDFDNQYTEKSDSHAVSLGWYTVDNALALLRDVIKGMDKANGNSYSGLFDPEGGTDYEEAVYAIMNGYKDSQFPSNIIGQTNDVIYVISDGENNSGWSSQVNQLWNEFIEGKLVTAVGVGSEDSIPKSGLNELAGANGEVVFIPDSEIKATLPQLRPTIGHIGSLLLAISGMDANEVVIDATKAQILQTIDSNGNVENQPSGLDFLVDNIGKELVVETQYGDFRIGQDGSYFFQPNQGAPTIESGKSVAFEVLITVKNAAGIESEQLVTLNVNHNGEINPSTTSSFNASTGDDQFRGTDNHDIILGHEGNDVLDGSLGDDILFGGAGDDILIGGYGNDILTGDEGADIFKWVDMDTATDRVTDFNAAEGDQLDLSDLFSDMEKDDITALLNDLSSGDNEGHVNGVDVTITQDNSAATLSISKGGEKLTIDFDGASAVDITSNLMDNLNHLKD